MHTHIYTLVHLFTPRGKPIHLPPGFLEEKKRKINPPETLNEEKMPISTPTIRQTQDQTIDPGAKRWHIANILPLARYKQ